ncbi:hypothetical protein [Nocardia nova]|uniref:hypothetical protein n=1 Tax=Nocardia nova TaxID=37330 RepID=UPI0018946928|nr:hypothetical protein [Nocardia nova]
MEQHATDAADATLLNHALSVLMQDLDGHADLIKCIANGMSVERIAADDGESVQEVKDRLRYVMSWIRRNGIRHTAWIEGRRIELREGLAAFEDIRGDELHGITRRIGQAVLRIDEQHERLWCDYHGWTDQLGRPTCQGCPCELVTVPFRPPMGRPRRTCSDACRQRTYRQRRSGSGINASSRHS